MTKKTGKLIIIRHGLTQYNAETRMTGQKDIPLLPEGEDQAKASGKLLDNTHIDEVFASPLERAYKTAELILDNMCDKATEHLKNDDDSWNIREDYDLMEQDTGDFTGRNYKEDTELVDFNRHFENAFPGGESTRDVLERLTEFYERDVKQHLEDGKTVMIACHANVVRAFKVLFEDMTPADLDKKKQTVKNAAPWVLEFAPETMDKLKSYMFEDQKPAEPKISNDNKMPKPKHRGFGR